MKNTRFVIIIYYSIIVYNAMGTDKLISFIYQRDDTFADMGKFGGNADKFIVEIQLLGLKISI